MQEYSKDDIIVPSYKEIEDPTKKIERLEKRVESLDRSVYWLNCTLVVFVVSSFIINYKINSCFSELNFSIKLLAELIK